MKINNSNISSSFHFTKAAEIFVQTGNIVQKSKILNEVAIKSRENFCLQENLALVLKENSLLRNEYLVRLT